MNDLWFWTLTLFYGTWLLLTLVRFAGPSALLRLRVPQALWGFLPNWSLFAPSPGVTDYWVMVRDRVGEAEPGPWVVAHCPEPRVWPHALWYPDKVQAKAVFDLVHQLADAIRTLGDPSLLERSAPYLQLLHFVRHLPRSGEADQRQFAIVLREPAHGYEATLLVSPYVSL